VTKIDGERVSDLNWGNLKNKGPMWGNRRIRKEAKGGKGAMVMFGPCCCTEERDQAWEKKTWFMVKERGEIWGEKKNE